MAFHPYIYDPESSNENIIEIVVECLKLDKKTALRRLKKAGLIDG